MSPLKSLLTLEVSVNQSNSDSFVFFLKLFIMPHFKNKDLQEKNER